MKHITLIIISAVVTIAAFSCMNDSQIEYRRSFTVGETLYYQHCQNCHGDKGEGLSALIPPLTDKGYFKTNISRLPCMIKYGTKHKLEIVGGKPYQTYMPPTGLAPIEIAQVLTYIGNSFGNKAGLRTLDQVNTDLQKCN